MQNKKLTYLLGLVVVIIWCGVIYRVFIAIKGDDDNTTAVAVSPVKEIYQDYAIPKDTTHLLLNYRDPFGLSKTIDTARIIKKTSIRTISIAKPSINWGFIKYIGYIKNPGSKKSIALLTINGKNVMLSEGETSENVKLLKSMRDSVKISFNGKIKFIPMNSGAL